MYRSSGGALSDTPIPHSQRNASLTNSQVWREEIRISSVAISYKSSRVISEYSIWLRKRRVGANPCPKAEDAGLLCTPHLKVTQLRLQRFLSQMDLFVSTSWSVRLTAAVT